MGLKESGLRGSIRNVSTGIGAAITIDTLEAENVDVDSATIRGEITELTNFGEDAEVFFEWGEITEGLPNTTDIQLQDTVGVFTEDLTNLSGDTTHEFQAFGSVQNVSDDGVVLTFETGAAIPDNVVDNFEEEPDGPYGDNDTLSTYWDDSELSSSEDAYIQTSTVIEGGRSLAVEGLSLNNVLWSHPNHHDLPRYPQQGEEFSVFGFIGEDDDTNLFWWFGMPDESGHDSGYRVGISNPQSFGDIVLYRVDDASATDLGRDSDAGDFGLWEVRVSWFGNDEIEADVYRHGDEPTPVAEPTLISELSGNDDNYTGEEGIGFSSSSDVTPAVFYDDWRVLGDA